MSVHWFHAASRPFDTHPRRPQPTFKLLWWWTEPEFAAYLLANHRDPELQRNIRKSHLETITEAMRSGHWNESTPGFIVFDEDGLSADGQHRLESVVESGQAQWLLYALDVPKSARKHLDLNARRSTAENLAMSGLRSLFHGLSENKVQSVVRCFATGMTVGYRALPVDELEHMLRFYDEGLGFALRLCSTNANRASGLYRGMIPALIARAYYHLPKSSLPRLQEFFDILVKGEVRDNDRDKGAMLFRDFLMSNNAKHHHNHQEVYAKGARALLLFLTGERRAQLQPVTKDPFPLLETPEAILAAAKAARKQGKELAESRLFATA